MCCRGVLQSLIEKHFPAPDRQKLYSLLGIDLSAKKTPSPSEPGVQHQQKGKKRKGNGKFCRWQIALLRRKVNTWGRGVQRWSFTSAVPEIPESFCLSILCLSVSIHNCFFDRKPVCYFNSSPQVQRLKSSRRRDHESMVVCQVPAQRRANQRIQTESLVKTVTVTTA